MVLQHDFRIHPSLLCLRIWHTQKHICIYTKSVFIKNDNHLEIRASEEHTKSYLKNTMVRRLLFWADRVSYYNHNIHYYKTFYFTTNYKTNATFLYMTWRSSPCFLVQGKPILVFWKTKTTASAGEKERQRETCWCVLTLYSYLQRA